MTDAPSTQPRILVIRGGAIGDFILTLPAIRLLRDHVPNAAIEILGYKPITALAEAAGLADSTRSIDHAAMAPFFAPGAKLAQEWMDYFASFELIVTFLYDPDGSFRGNLERAGAETIIECSHRVDPSLGTHAASQLAKPLEQLAMFLDDPAARIDVGSGAATPDPAAPLVAIHPGSGSPRKNWGFENWIAVAEAIRGEIPGARFLVCSGEAERETIDEFEALMAAVGAPFDSLREAPLPALAERLSVCATFLGHDSGISHLAAAVGCRCVLIFGPTDPDVWAPAGEHVRAIEAPRGRLDALPPDPVAAAAIESLRAAIPRASD